MKTHTICPCCKRAYPKPRAADNPARKLEQDIARATAAIEVLKRAQPDPLIRYNPPSVFAEAMQDEILRLSNAIEHTAKLWAIYRRADKGASYAHTARTESQAAD